MRTKTKYSQLKYISTMIARNYQGKLLSVILANLPMAVKQ